jgi:hypothetical protein
MGRKKGSKTGKKSETIEQPLNEQPLNTQNNIEKSVPYV